MIYINIETTFGHCNDQQSTFTSTGLDFQEKTLSFQIELPAREHVFQ